MVDLTHCDNHCVRETKEVFFCTQSEYLSILVEDIPLCLRYVNKLN
jgi:hypothetical protein